MEVWQSTWPVVELDLARPLAGAAGVGPPHRRHRRQRLPPARPPPAPRARSALGRPTTVLWLPELSEDAVLAAMKAGRGYVTEAPGRPAPRASRADGAPMGATIPRGRIAAEAEVRGAAGDTLVWIDASRPGPGRARSPATTGADRLARRARALPPRRDRRRRQPRRHPRRASARAVGDRPLPEGLTRGRPRRATRSAAPSPIRSTSRPDPCSSATRPAPGASTTPTAHRIAAEAYLDEVAAAGYRGTELGPFGFLPTDPGRARRRARRPRPHADRRRPRPHLRRSRRRPRR